MTNFDRFLSDPQFTSFAEAAVAAEKILQIDLAACILNCRRAMECGVKWMYSVDGALVKPWQDTLVNLMNAGEFREIVGKDLWKRMDHIRRMGNAAAHGGKALTRAQAELCLENLYIFLDFVAYCYGAGYQEGQFDRVLLQEKRASFSSPSGGAVERSETERARTEQSFLVPKEEIVENGYDLSINKYKKTEYVPVEYPPTSEIFAQLRQLEAEIQKGLEELEGMV